MTDLDRPIRKKSSANPANLGLFPGAPVVRVVNKRNHLSAVDGDGGDHKALGRAPFRSLLERDLRTLLGANPAIECYAIEPHTLEYHLPTENAGFDKRTYVPDVVCRYRSGEIVVIDAKAAFIAADPKWTLREPHIREAYEVDHGVMFVVLDEDEIRPQPRLANCEILEGHRYVTCDHEAMDRVRSALEDFGSPVTIAAVARAARLADRPGECRAYTAIMNLALAGEVRLDLDRPFGFDTIVHAGGRS